MPAGTRRKSRYAANDEEIEDPSSQSTQRHAEEDRKPQLKKEKAANVKKEKKPKLSENNEGDDDDDAEVGEDERIDVENLTNQPLGKNDLIKLKGIITDWDNIGTKVIESSKHINDVVPTLVEFVDGDDQTAAIKKLDLLVRDLMDLRAEMSAHQESIEESYQRVAVEDEIDDFLQNHKQVVKGKLKKYSDKTSRQKYGDPDGVYINFKSTLWENTEKGGMPPISTFIPREEGDDSDDDDFEMGGVTQDYKCPLTLKELLDPIRAPCGHHFDKDGLRDMFSRGGRKECPATGCSAVYTWAQCKRDDELAKKVKAWKRRNERQRDEDEDADEIIE